LPTKFIELAGEINTQMPQYVVRRTMETLDQRGTTLHGSSGLVLGVSYKPNVDDVRESPALEILEILRDCGANVEYHDPHVPRIPTMRHYDLEDMVSVPLTPELLKSKDFVLVVTNHADIDWELVVSNSPLIIDTRNATAGFASDQDNIVRA